MLIDLRDRALRHAQVPELPRGWNTEVVVRPAGGASFSGDFVLATLSADERLLELALVDVSGKGVESGTRSLLLSGGLSGLLGGVPAEQFLRAANDYLLRQRWVDAFATAVHLAVDLKTGGYVLGSAGHPPAGRFLAGSGRWGETDASGTALGIAQGATFNYASGTMAPGDAVLLYTDGLVETPGGDIDVGIDKLFGQAELLIPRGFRSGAQRLVDAATRPDDDRAVVLVWRD
jgi:serine phosphatase RsbU (regulator of sigma subunit)